MVLAVLVFINISAFFGISFGAKNYALAKFRENKKNNQKFYNELTGLINEHDAGADTAFAGSGITYTEILDVLREKLDIIYSDAEQERLINGRFSKKEISEYVEKMKYHQEAIEALQARMDGINLFEGRATA